MCKTAIVILNWNGADIMRKYLPSVISNSYGDVIVADNASTDDSVQMLQKEFPDVRVIHMSENYGFAEGYNRSLGQLSEFDYYILLNSDVRLTQKHWDKILTDYMDEHPECAACQPKLLDLKILERQESHHEPQHDAFEYAGACGGFLDQYGYPFCRGRIFGSVENDKGQYDDVTNILWATGAALCVRASDWRMSGGLDPRFFAHMEEIDLCWRLRTMGRNIVCIPQSTAFHLGGATLSHSNPRKTFLNFRNNLLMLYKNLPQDELHKVMRTRMLLDFVAAAQFLLKGEPRNTKAVVSAYRSFRKMKKTYRPIRKDLLTRRKTGHVNERYNISIVWQYYVKGKTQFSELNLR